MVRKVEEITIKANGSDLGKAFAKLAEEMFNIVVNVSDVDLEVTKTILIRSRDLNHLLIQFMKRLFDLANLELFVLSTIKQITIDKISNEYLLDAVIIGDKMDANKYIVKDIVKQVTDRNVSVIEDKFGVHLQMNLVVEWRNIPGEDESEEV